MDIDDDNLLLLIEEWADMQSLRARVCAETFKIVLAALDYASEEPEVRFDTVTGTRGMAFVSACRGASRPEPWPDGPEGEESCGP